MAQESHRSTAPESIYVQLQQTVFGATVEFYHRFQELVYLFAKRLSSPSQIYIEVFDADF